MTTRPRCPLTTNRRADGPPVRGRGSSRLAVALGALGALACSAGGASLLVSGRLVDLTHPFDRQTVYWPTAPGFDLTPLFSGTTEDGVYTASNRFQAAEHGGTHVDAPLHFDPRGRGVDELPLERLVGPGVRIDVTEACARDGDTRVGVRDFERWEDEHGRMPAGVIVLIHTGFSRYWPDRALYLGTQQRGPEARRALRFPGLAPEAARWLAEERGVAAVGIDTASIDAGRARRFETHQVLARREIPAFENLTDLEKLPPRGFWVIALPMSIRAGTGAPLRAIAVVPEPE